MIVELLLLEKSTWETIRPLVLQTNFIIFQSMLVNYWSSHCVQIVICSVNWKYIFDKFGSFLPIIPTNILNIYTPKNIYLYLKWPAGKRRPTSWSACINSDEVAGKMFSWPLSLKIIILVFKNRFSKYFKFFNINCCQFLTRN